MTSPGEVQGVRFLSGAIIDAKPEDAEKLIRSGKAVRVDENGNIIEFLEDDFDNQDASRLCRRGRRSCRQMTNGGSEANDSDNANDDETMPSAMTDEQTAEAANDEQAVMAAADNATSDDATIADAAEIEQPNSADDELSVNADDKT